MARRRVTGTFSAISQENGVLLEMRVPLNPVFPLVGQVRTLLEEILERVTDEFNLPELMARVEERTPYTVVAFQECERMNLLTREMQRSLTELDLGLKVGVVLGRTGIARWAPLGRK